MNFELTGKIIEIYKEQQVSERFKKREFVIDVPSGNFSEQIKFQLTQDKTDLVDSYKLGEEVKVHFNIKGNKWKDGYFVNLQAWRLEKAGSKSSAQSNALPELSDRDVPPEPIGGFATDNFAADDGMPF